MIKSKKLNITNLIYIIIFLMLLCTVLQNTLIEFVYPNLGKVIVLVHKLLRIVIMFLGIINLFSKKRNIKHILLSILMLAIFILNYFNTGYYMFFDMFFIPIFFYKDLEYEKIVNIYLKTMIGMLLFIFILYLFHFFPNTIFRIYKNSAFTYRNSLGFRHPNALGNHVLIIASLILLKNKENINFLHIIEIFLMLLFVFIIPQSFTSTYLILAILLFLIYTKIINKKINKSFVHKLLKKYYILIIPLIMIFSYLIFSKGMFIDKISTYSSTLKSRYILSSEAIDKYNIHLFGSKINIIGKYQIMFYNNLYSQNDYSPIDNFFTYFLLNTGVIGIIFFTIYYIYLFKESLKQHNGYLCLIMIIMLLYSLSENSIVMFTSAFIYILPVCKQINYDIINKKNNEGEIDGSN